MNILTFTFCKTTTINIYIFSFRQTLTINMFVYIHFQKDYAAVDAAVAVDIFLHLVQTKCQTSESSAHPSSVVTPDDSTTHHPSVEPSMPSDESTVHTSFAAKSDNSTAHLLSVTTPVPSAETTVDTEEGILPTEGNQNNNYSSSAEVCSNQQNAVSLSPLIERITAADEDVSASSDGQKESDDREVSASCDSPRESVDRDVSPQPDTEESDSNTDDSIVNSDIFVNLKALLNSDPERLWKTARSMCQGLVDVPFASNLKGGGLVSDTGCDFVYWQSCNSMC